MDTRTSGAMVMQQHDFMDMPGKNTAEGQNPHETVMLLRCKWCMKTPSKAREDGCPIHELEEKGRILLSAYNPQGIEYFKDRKCLTCEQPIMGHWLRRGMKDYWCYENQNQFSDGIEGCVYEVDNVVLPVEPSGSQNARI